jgi:hypothetical protein
MEPWAWAVIIFLAVVIPAAIIIWLFQRQQRSKTLREGFGPEYEHAVEEHGDRRRAETELAQRRKRIEKLHIRPLNREEHDRYADAWRATQTRFVDSPKEAIGQADRLVGEVMAARGYPMSDFEQRAADVSVDHPHVVSNYRSAHGIHEASDRGEASTEQLRQAMVHYRALFDELLEAPEPADIRSRR